MKIGKYISSFLKAADLTKPTLFTIASVDEEDIGDETKLVMRVEESEVPIALGKTTLVEISEILGSDETEDWVGNKVVAYNDKSVLFQGKKVGGIRFRAPKDSKGNTLEVKRPEAMETPFE